MATQKNQYGSLTAFVITLASLASYAAQEGTLVTNAVNLFIDMIISGFITVGAAAAIGDCYLLLSSSDGTNISSPASGSNAVISPALNIDLLGTLNPGDKVPGTELIFATRIKTRGIAATTKVSFEPIAVSQLFGGALPPGGIAPVIVNCQGQAFDATGGHFAINYTGLTYQIA